MTLCGLVALALCACGAGDEAGASGGAGSSGGPGAGGSTTGGEAPAPGESLATVEGGLCGDCTYPYVGFLPKLPFPSGVAMGLRQSWCCQCNGCADASCTSHTGPSSYGLDFDMSGGDDCGVHVLAAAAGVVSKVRTDVTCQDCPAEGFGNWVVIDHGNGIYSRYGHLAPGSVSVSGGMTVCQGQHIGDVGATGQASQCHLHFQLEDASGASVPFSKFAETPAVPICTTGTNPYVSKNGEVASCGDQPAPTGCAAQIAGEAWLVIDDGDPCFEKKNTWYTQTVGTGGESHFTYSWGGAQTPDTGPNGGASDSSCQWSATAQSGGQHEVQVYLPKGAASSQQAKYEIVAGGGKSWKTVDQSTGADTWAPLGVVTVAAGQGITVRLTDNTGEPQLAKKIVADAVRVRWVGETCEGACVAGQTECVSGTAWRECVSSGAGCTAWSAPKPCDDGNPCTTNACLGGGCQAASSSAPCSDGDPCTEGDSCSGGACVGAPLACDDGDPCSADSCSGGACVHAPLTGACDDGDPCTLDDTCKDGACVGKSLGCSDGNPCTLDGCLGTECVFTPTSAACDDGDPCTAGDTCASGVCVGQPVSCEAWEDACNGATCVDGECVEDPLTDAPCDDGDPCTTGDTCKGGQCLGAPLDCAAEGDACNAGVCKGGLCAKKPLWLPCDDGDPCTLADFCVMGECRGEPLDCAGQSDLCGQGLCWKGACVKVPLVDAPCDDGRSCTVDDLCQGGACVGTVATPCCSTDWDCNDDVGCTIDKCLPGGLCASQPVKAPFCCATDAECATGDPCVVGRCEGGVCATEVIWAPACCHGDEDCEDGNPLTLDVCAAATCVGKPWPGACAADADCHAVGPCVTVACVAGACVATSVEGCCLGDSQCDDGVSCTVDRCANGVCTNESACCKEASACDDGDDCTEDLCAAGACAHEATCCAADGDCDDGDPCTADACNGEACVHEPPPCGDGVTCSADGCCGVCAVGATCGPDGVCVAAGCEGVGEGGLCDGAILRRCEGGAVVSVSCAASGQGCGVDAESGVAGCCTASCAGRACGDDGCGGTCGSCPAGMRCTDDHACENLSMGLPVPTGSPDAGGGSGDVAGPGGGPADVVIGGTWEPPVAEPAPGGQADDGGCASGGPGGRGGLGAAAWAVGLLLVLAGRLRAARRRPLTRPR